MIKIAKRKKQYVETITTKDREMLKTFSRVGYLSKDMIIEKLGMSARRIDNFCRDNYLEKVTYLNEDNSYSDCYRLANRGKTLCTNKLSVDYFYRSSSAAHDLKLAENYFKFSDDIKNSWITETELRAMFHDKLDVLKLTDPYLAESIKIQFKSNELSTTDAAYINNENRLVTLEVVTNSYRKSDILAKEKFTEFMNASYNQLN